MLLEDSTKSEAISVPTWRALLEANMDTPAVVFCFLLDSKDYTLLTSAEELALSIYNLPGFTHDIQTALDKLKEQGAVLITTLPDDSKKVVIQIPRFLTTPAEYKRRDKYNKEENARLANKAARKV